MTHEGLRRIVDERHRQITEEGWTPEHDAEHDRSELARAAACYALAAAGQTSEGPPGLWPWADEWWKVSDLTVDGRIRMLEKAGALIAAEIDRLLNNIYRDPQQ